MKFVSQVVGFVSLLCVQISSQKVPTVEIADGVYMPLVGLGTWLYNDTVAYGAVTNALSMGYPHIDTAFNYGNAKGVGHAIAEHVSGNKQKRSDLFITTKVMAGIPEGGDLNMHDLAIKHLKDLKLDYVDLLLLHFPCKPSGDDCIGGRELRQAQWKDLESLVKEKKVRAIGVSHYCPHHLQDIFDIMTIKPAVNQVQYHVGMGKAVKNATDDREFDEDHGILYQSFSPLCGPCTAEQHMELLNGPLVSGIGKKYGKTGAQISLKWQVQQGIPVIPKSSSVTHLRENLDLFDFTLSDDDMEALTNADSPPVSGGPSATDSGDCSIV